MKEANASPKDAALRLALEALGKVTKQMLAIRDELAERGGRPTNNFVHEELWDSSFDVYINCTIPTAETIKAALQAKDEPVAWISPSELLVMRGNALGGAKDWRVNVGLKPEDGDVGLYTTPPQRTWVGLTDEEIRACIASNKYAFEIVRAAEAKLKEKNT